MKQKKSNSTIVKSDFSVNKAEDSSGFLLWQVTSLWQREIRYALEPLKLTHSQFVLLASILWLTHQNMEVTQVLLSEHTKIDPMTTSTVIRTLIQKGYVDRREHSSDTRAKIVSLTKSGETITKSAVKKVETFDHEFFSALGVTKHEFNESLLKILSKY
ncbi:MarR family transcriptional regulator [Leptospira levettii]|uniref:MarR family transcriptional regulator n=1 Tax=Leptospira levettii TaxID=2023178 RepID=A0A2N0AY92_9LEPT|nr:MarR family transcriptional regulator [Leptospira levettii]MCW7465048.1 MarR family transcriptional regulator [Leptospira levettii]MCW7473879.1 MarR family transcriptional regulator [Leptospira levettii]MCW7507737.1 MarR family transcriptional regulator [Leptospira levettii]MCW7509788.1 MarR family transcriptional regulator [Leptospira levettii]MCW7513538.1 MarR family transcriptional regulator [Leptospira levettii]